MSPTKLKSLLTGAFFAIIVVVVSSSVVASDLRPFKPYTSDSFGGGRRSNDGVYGALTAIYWSFSTPEGGYIGATNAKGGDETRWVYDLGTDALRRQANSLKIDMLSPSTTLGTKFEVGNRRGHHGWLVSGYGLPSQGHGMSAQNVSMAIRDEGNFDGSAYGVSSVGYLWGPQYGTVPTMVFVDQGPAGPNTRGYLPDPSTGNYTYYSGPTVTTTDTGSTAVSSGTSSYVPVGATYYLPEVQNLPGPVTVAPLPVTFESIAVSVNSKHQSAELMYTYRPHPFAWGSMELLAGARYWSFDDKFGLTGVNTIVTGAPGSISAFEAMVVNAEGKNCVLGPQFGLKLYRHNARWTFGAEGRFTAGINAQTIKTGGYITPNSDYAPVGLHGSNNTNFGHAQNKTYFSPILEGRLSADWQWTSAVSFFGAVNGQFADNIARGVRVTDYVVKSDGTIFGIRGNDRNAHVFVYGVELGFKINR